MFLKLFRYILFSCFISSCGMKNSQWGIRNDANDLAIYQAFVEEDNTISFLDAATYTFQYVETCSDGTSFTGQLATVFSKTGVSCQFQISSFSDGTNNYTPAQSQALIAFNTSGLITSTTSALYTGASGSKVISLYHQLSPDSITINLVESSITPATGLSEEQEQITFPKSGIVSTPGGLLNTYVFTSFTFSTSIIKCDSVNKRITLRMTNTKNSADTVDVIFSYTGSLSVTKDSLRYITIGTGLIVSVSPLDICQTNPTNILLTNGWLLNQGGGQGVTDSTAQLVYKPSLNSSDVNKKLTSGSIYTTSYTLGTGGNLAVSKVSLYSYSFSLPL